MPLTYFQIIESKKAKHLTTEDFFHFSLIITAYSLFGNNIANAEFYIFIFPKS